MTDLCESKSFARHATITTLTPTRHLAFRSAGLDRQEVFFLVVRGPVVDSLRVVERVDVGNVDTTD